MKKELLHSCPELIDYINETGFLPLLSMGINGWSAEEVVDEDCQYTRLPDGGWEWPLWEWKGAILQESGCAYGKFFKDKAAFISREWWPDFCNYRRSVYPYPEAGSIEESILDVLKSEGSLITRELRAACGFTGPKMRSRFDAYITLWKWAATSLQKTLFIPAIATGKNTDGDGHCHNAGNTLRKRGLSSRPHPTRITRTDAQSIQKDSTGCLRKDVRYLT